MSYNPGGLHIPSRDSLTRVPDVSRPGPVNSGIAYVPRLPRSQLARPINHTPRSSRVSSLSNAEETSHIPAPSTVYQQTGRTNRLSMLPRPSTGGPASTTSPAPSLSPQTPIQPIPSSLSTPDVTTPSAFAPSYQAPPAKRTRNVLRRKAPTIGKHVEQAQSQKLSLVIPQSPPNTMKAPRFPFFPETSSAGPSASSQSSGDRSLSSAVEPPKAQAPEELASLRTAINTQNLSPPTPFFPSASSPSTRYSESPGMWSRGSTPTSLSSYSPGIIHSTKVGRMRQPSPSQTRLPVFTPPSAHASPQSAQSDRSESKAHRSALPRKSTTPISPTSTGPQRKPSAKSIATNLRGPPCSPPPRKSSINFSPPKESTQRKDSKNSDIDVEKARREVEEAERELFNSQRAMAAASSGTSVPKTPPRPSRDGAPRLDLETSPVIQSNLPYLRMTGHKARESVEKAQPASRPQPTRNQSAAVSVDSLRSKDLSRIPSREAGSPVMARKSPRTLVKEPPKEKEDPQKTAASKRFGLFSKKSKPDLDNNSGEQARPPRKGPAAGTGHEGYGKYAQRGRKASASSSSGVRTRSTSTTRSASRSISSSKGSMSSRPDLELDDFLMSRLDPVIINGGGVDGATLSRTQSEQSISSLSVASSSNLPRPTPLTSSTAQSTESLATSIGAFGATKTPSESTTSLTLTQSKSPERTSIVANRLPLKSRMPIPKGKKLVVSTNPEAGVTRTSLANHDSSSATPQHSQRTMVRTTKPKAPAKSDVQQPQKRKSSRWNIFQRSRSDEPKPPAPPPPPPASHTAQLHAAISPVLKNRSVAHYALVDADSDELDDILNNVEDSPPTEEEIIVPVEVPAGLNIRKRHPSILLPSPPKLQGEFEKDDRPSPRTAMFNRNMMRSESEQSPEDRRPRRLASVGRIPQVVSRRDRQHRPAIQSFSRPFSVVDSPSLTAPMLEATNENPVFPESPLKHPSDAASSQAPDRGFDLDPAFSVPAHVSALDFLAGPYSADEFIHFSPNKVSPSSSSSGALAAVTAVVPKQDTAPMEDEVWKEYDDLIDTVLSPEEPEPVSSGQPQEDDRFELATMASRALQDGLNNSNSLQPGLFVPTRDSIRSSSDSIRLRRSQIVSALHSSLTPSSQPSYSNLIASYGDSNDDISNSPVNPAQPPLDSVQEQQSTFLHSLANATTPTPKSSGDRKSVLASSERDWDTVTRTNMRSASLMTSRWLSFGRVLFSPAHNHVKAGSQGRILVIDGLGNDDWSFYCSLTYPDAEVYSLSDRPVSTAIPHPAAWQPPTNHHTVYHAGLQNPLPFPKDYFTAAVLRFPAANSELVQSNIIQECKRVLRSGGYLEMSILDRDLINMGVRTRKAVRHLKEMTYLDNSTISLKPTSDSVQRLIGTQGFDNLRRCMVRIPVAGMVVRSSDSTTSSSNKSLLATGTTSSTAFSLPAISVTTAAGSWSTRTPSKSSPSDDTNISLGDLLSDPSPSAANDESIARIVARVGRWWYTKCYEDPVIPDTGEADSSMWNDRKLLRECQKRGTGFRMLIAYAQKPSEVKRRTASV
ncbi:uncharacterized protein N7459_001443 [Penicillium hispanicum]|uniref:uncharacterized protein n=1 Tax=Penicillium hispanicum TaxID=1080232 RepID=UPI00253F8A8D|nr:uncharacterized protein N7459_001443 [Penicillium hispanicum]KAJ5595235.1 hypothetical protein N7459_001443 [Penicillium hispanicum]